MLPAVGAAATVLREGEGLRILPDELASGFTGDGPAPSTTNGTIDSRTGLALPVGDNSTGSDPFADDESDDRPARAGKVESPRSPGWLLDPEVLRQIRGARAASDLSAAPLFDRLPASTAVGGVPASPPGGTQAASAVRVAATVSSGPWRVTSDEAAVADIDALKQRRRAAAAAASTDAPPAASARPAADSADAGDRYHSQESRGIWLGRAYDPTLTEMPHLSRSRPMSAALRAALAMPPPGNSPETAVLGVPADAPFAARYAFRGGSRGWDREQLQAVAAGRLDGQVAGEVALLKASLAVFQ